MSKYLEKRYRSKSASTPGGSPQAEKGGQVGRAWFAQKHTIIFLIIVRVDLVRVDEVVGAAQGSNGGITTEHCRGKECQNTKGREWRGYSMHPAVEH